MDNILILPYVIIVVTLVAHFTEEVKVFHLFSVLGDQRSFSPGSSSWEVCNGFVISVLSLLLLPAFVPGFRQSSASPAGSLPHTASPAALLPSVHIWFTLLRPGPWHVFYPVVCIFLHGTIYHIFSLAQLVIYSSIQFTSSHSGD